MESNPYQEGRYYACGRVSGVCVSPSSGWGNRCALMILLS